MATTPPDPTPAEPRRFRVRLPRPLWMGLAAVVVIIAGLALRFGLPIDRQQAALREIERLGGKVVNLSNPTVFDNNGENATNNS